MLIKFLETKRNRTIVNKHCDIMVKLCKSLVRPHVEYSTAVWSPYFVKDRKLIEKIQHRFAKMITPVKQLSYTDKLLKFGLWTIEERRSRADLIEVCMMIHGLTTISHNRFFELATNKKT